MLTQASLRLSTITGLLLYSYSSHYVVILGCAIARPYSNVLVVLLKGVGDSAQGFANCVLFVFLVRSVRHRYQRAVCGCCQCRRRHLTITSSEQAPVPRLDNAAGDDCTQAAYCNSNIPLTVSPVVVSADSFQL